MTRLLFTFFLIALLTLIPGFAEADENQTKIAMILSIGGLGDEAFNDAAFRGFQMAKEDFDITLDYVEPGDVEEFEEHQRYFAREGYNLIITIGFYQEATLEEIAPDYPDVQFAIIDGIVEQPNITSITFREHEGSFLVGILAGWMTKSNKVGFVGGAEIPLLRKFEVGFIEGVKHANSEAEVFVNYAGNFVDPQLGKEIALSKFERGIDVIFHAAGGTGLGVIEASEEFCFYSIGVDSDQDHLAPGKVLTSMLKRIDVAVYETIEKFIRGELDPGLISLGLEEEGVGTTDFRYTRGIIPAEVFSAMEEAREKIIKGEITIEVPGF